ncbi:MAG: amidohydrolase family protein [Thermotogota bacterium]
MKIIKGNFVFSENKNSLKIKESNYLVIKDNLIVGFKNNLDNIKEPYDLYDYGRKMIIPSFYDMHLHASQFNMKGLGMDKELIDWLNDYTFKEEKTFSDEKHAKNVYDQFCKELIKQGTFNIVVYSTIHKETTDILFKKLEEYGINAYIGKVNMDRNCPDFLKEDTDKSIKETEELIQKFKDNKKVKPIITPRFAPTSTPKLLEGLGHLAVKYNIPVQSHLSENPGEVEWVKNLYPEAQNYSQVYYNNNLFGQTKTLMAHCIYVSEEGKKLMKDNRVVAVHCPSSNLNLSSGIMKVREFLDYGIDIYLGSDIGAGDTLSMREIIKLTIQMSKIVFRNNAHKPLDIEEAFYLATKAPAEFFGNKQSFEKGKPFNALVIDDEYYDLNLKERLSKFIYNGDDRNIYARYLDSKLIHI